MKRMREVHGMARVTLIMGFITLFGCSQYDVIPKSLDKQVDKSVTFNDIKTSPARYKGQVVVLGGEVLSAKRMQNSTRIEALSLPLSDELVPMTDKRESGGRFYAFDGGKEIVDPAVLKEGTPITVVGEVTGTTTGTIDKGTYVYPTLVIKDLTKWEKTEAPRFGYRYPYYGGAYWGGYRPFFFGFYP